MVVDIEKISKCFDKKCASVLCCKQLSGQFIIVLISQSNTTFNLLVDLLDQAVNLDIIDLK